MRSLTLRLLEGVSPGRHERQQAERLVNVMLWVVLLVALVLGALNFAMGWRKEAVALSVAVAMSVVGIVLGRRGRPRLSAATLCMAMSWALLLSAYYGTGVYDSAVIAFPLLILTGTFVLGRGRAGLVIATAVAVASVFALAGAQALGLIDVPYPVSWLRPLVASIIFVATGRLAWFMHHTWEGNTSAIVESYEATLRGWARLLEAKGGDVAGHSQRVTDLSEALARHMGCSAEELEALRHGAYLHDIGKMAVPDSILLKPGPLDSEERRAIERHPEVAQDIISEIPYLQAAAVVPHSHHERWDGGGYPQGLKAEEIPCIARIFTVADQWDALISDRPYREALPVEDVTAYMRENVGRIYDPKVIDALMEMLAEDEAFWVGR